MESFNLKSELLKSLNLNEREEEALYRFVEDKIMKETIKKIVLSSIYGQGTAEYNPAINWANSILENDMPLEEKYQHLLAVKKACDLVYLPFRVLDSVIRPVKPVKQEVSE